MTQQIKRMTASIDLDDVLAAGSVEEAILAWAKESADTSSGVVGAAFSTSGPGSGWSRTPDCNDFAERAFREGALHYIDAADGRCISTEEVDEERDEDGELPEDVYSDICGCYYRIGDWTDESVVELVCPSIEEAVEHPDEVAAMARAIIDFHHDRTDCAAWAKLVQQIRQAAYVLDDIDTGVLENS